MVGSKARQKPLFACRDCGHQSPKWMGFCPAPSCGSALPLVETSKPTARPPSSRWFDSSSEPLQELSSIDPLGQARIKLPWQELNRVLGGGIVPGSVVLLAGEPGVGKSTLLLQIAQLVSAAGDKVLYVSGEESPHQVKLRSQRLGFKGDGVFLFSETDVDLVVERLEEFKPDLAVIDSVQTLFSQDAPSGPGSVAQVREAGLRLMRWAKARQVPIFMAGHMTKDGSLAGPRVLEHMVDVVTYLESQDLTTFRILRNGKNRFGSTDEVGIFEMTAQGLVEVPDPSQALLSQRYEQAVGSVLIPVLEGSRPLLLEVQALTSPSQIPVPRRVVNGVEYNRLLMLAAVASRRAGLELSAQDIIVSVAGGFRVSEPASDLAVVLALASSIHNRAVDSSLVAFGEVGLSGELRTVPQGQRRLQEAVRLGFSRCILPQGAVEASDVPGGIEVIAVRTLREAIGAALGPARNHRVFPATGERIDRST